MKDSKRIIKSLSIFFGSIVVLIGILVLLQYLFDTEGPFGEYMLFRKAKDGNSLWAKDYIERYPQGKYLKKVELAYSQASFIEAKSLALDTTYLYCNDKCEKIFEFIKNFNKSPEYPEAIKIAEEYGYHNYKQLKNWSRIFDYMEMFPNSPYTKEFTILKDKSIDSALMNLNLLIQSRTLNKNQAKLLKYILDNSKGKAKQLALCLKMIPEISIADQKKFMEFSLDGSKVDRKAFKDYEFYFAEFSKYHIESQLSEQLFKTFGAFLPGSNFFRFDKTEVSNLPVLEIKYKVYNLFAAGNTSKERPLISQFYYEKHQTKTITTTKRVSEYSRVQKDWVYKNVTETKTEIDYSKPSTYDPGGYFYYLGFDFVLNLNMSEEKEDFRVEYNYKPKIGEALPSQKLENIYNKMSDEAVNRFVGSVLPKIDIKL